MSFLGEIRGFSKCCLKPTETIVTTTGGQKLIESHDSSGRLTVTNTGVGSLGFVGDYKPDLQVGTILPGLLISSQDVAADWSLLEELSVTHVLNLAPQCGAEFTEDLTYLCVDMLDLPSQGLKPVLPQCLSFIQTAIDSGGCVLVHCNAGVSRSATIVIAYLMHTQHLQFQQAYDLVKSQRPAIRPNDGFVAELKQLQHTCVKETLKDV